MNPYGYYPEYLPVQPEPMSLMIIHISNSQMYMISTANHHNFKVLKEELDQLERQNEDQTRELARQNREINRINQNSS